ncbi:MAG: LPD11 domain-containing protein [Lachnospiraceae bacterium]|nr:LPD11 domain-containing protein [Lachnospiraceae bacterium]
MNEICKILENDATFRYQLLERMRTDCDYYLGYGNRNANNLWAGNEKTQIEYMKALYQSFEVKPEWLTYNQILVYETKMTREDYVLHTRCFESFLEHFLIEYHASVCDADVELLHDNIDLINGHLTDDISEDEIEKAVAEFMIHISDFIEELPSYQKIKIEEKLKPFAGYKDLYGGIALHLTDHDEIFTVSFGDGTNIEEGYDDYLYIAYYHYDEEVAKKMVSQEYDESDWQEELEEISGGQLDFRYDDTDYDEDITKAVYDALMLIYGEIPSFEPLVLYRH